jgi:phospholipase D3/4
VKELGIYFADCPQIAKTVEIYFQNLWKLSTLNSTAYTKVAWDKQWQAFRKVPCWSHFLKPEERCRSIAFSVVYTELVHKFMQNQTST